MSVNRSIAEHITHSHPGYPVQIIWLLKKNLWLDADFTVADLDAGTGVSSVLFAPHVKKVYGVEHDETLRIQAKQLYGNVENLIFLKGEAAATTLSDASVDMVVWTRPTGGDTSPLRTEFKRILKLNRPLVIIENQFNTAASSFMRTFNDFLKVHIQGRSDANTFYGNIFENGSARHEFAHEQHLTFEELKSLYLSLPDAYTDSTDPRHALALDALHELFGRFEYNGNVIVAYNTVVSIGMLNKKQIALWKKFVFHILRIPAFFAYLFLLTGMFFGALIRKFKKRFLTKTT